jgi:hypothetical protein
MGHTFSKALKKTLNLDGLVVRDADDKQKLEKITQGAGLDVSITVDASKFVGKGNNNVEFFFKLDVVVPHKTTTDVQVTPQGGKKL